MLYDRKAEVNNKWDLRERKILKWTKRNWKHKRFF